MQARPVAVPVPVPVLHLRVRRPRGRSSWLREHVSSNITSGDGVEPYPTPSSLETSQHPCIAFEKLATRTRRIQLDQEPRAEQEAPRQQEPSPQMMAEDSAPTRPTEGVQNRSEPIEMENVYKRLRSPFCLPSRRWIRWGCSGAGGTWRRRETA